MAKSSPHLGIPHMPADLERVEAELNASIQTEDPFLTEVAGHLLRAGGKRIRPAFSIAAATSSNSDVAPATQEAVLGGVSVELVHLGSLYHDDVMDDAVTRRTVESVNARWGNLKAILAGDFLLAKASEIAAGLGTDIARLLAATIGRLCEGQIRELKDVYNTNRTEDDYYASIRGKTAALFATACQVGGIVGELPDTAIEQITKFGHSYGMAFQIADDVLDLVASAEVLGKPTGQDLVEGVYTLPVLRTLESSEGDELRSILGKPLDADEREKARAIVLRTDATRQALVEAQRFIDEAATSLEEIPSMTISRQLGATAQFLLERVQTAAV